MVLIKIYRFSVEEYNSKIWTSSSKSLNFLN